MKQTLIILIIISLTSCMNNKDKLTSKIKSLGFPKNEIVVTIDEFFIGNEDSSSIGANLFPDPLSPKEFYEKFKDIKKNKNVNDILVRITDIEDCDWPYSDAVYIITTSNLEQVKEMFKDLRPDEVYVNWLNKVPINAPNIPADMKVYSIWWD